MSRICVRVLWSGGLLLAARARVISMWAAEGLLRLLSRCCVGRLGAELRQSLIDDAGACVGFCAFAS